MTRNDYYSVYQANIEMLEIQIEMVKKSVQSKIGHYLWLIEERHNSYQISATDKEVVAGTRLFVFLICSWLEARLLKILYEGSSVALTSSEIASIRGLPSMNQKWKEMFSLAVCKGYSLTYAVNTNYSANFMPGSIQLQNYNDILVLFVDIEDAITIRNRLAHGQWEIQFNSNSTAKSNYPFFSKYDNIQKLTILYQYYNLIAEIISDYITYKDKGNSKFDRNISAKVKKAQLQMQRIQHVDFQKYGMPFKCLESKKRAQWKNTL